MKPDGALVTDDAPHDAAGDGSAPNVEQVARRIVSFCDWLPPDFGAVGQYGVLFAREMASRGHHVTLAGLSSTVDDDMTETVGHGVLRRVRLKTAIYDKTDARRRLFWTIGTNTRLVRALWSEMTKADTIQFTGSPPLFLHWIALANVLLRKRLVYRITDFHPECAMVQAGRTGVLLGMLYRMTLFWRRRVDEFEVLGHDGASRLRDIGIPADRIRLKRDSSPVCVEPGTPALRRPAGSASQLLLLYSGNWGVAHDARTFVGGYREHRRRGSARFLLWLNAVGAGADAVEEALSADGLPFVRGAPVPLDRLAALLVTPDAHLITLSDAFAGFVLPSKVYGCRQSGRPVLFIGSERSDVHALCRDMPSLVYERVAIGDIAGCAAALDRLARHVDGTKDHGG